MAHKHPMNEHWLTSRSKKIPGRIYFYNPETSESVWSLADIDPARRKYIYVSSKPIDHSYPEPINTPSQSNQSSNDASQIINKPINSWVQLQQNVQRSNYANMWQVPSPALLDQDVTNKMIEKYPSSTNKCNYDATKQSPNKSAPIILSNDLISNVMDNRYLLENQQFINASNVRYIQPHGTNEFDRFQLINTNKLPNITNTQSQNMTQVKYFNGFNFMEDDNEVKLLSGRFKEVQEKNSEKRIITSVKKRKPSKNNCVTKKNKKLKVSKEAMNENVATPLKKSTLSTSEIQAEPDLDPNDLRFKLSAKRNTHTKEVNGSTAAKKEPKEPIVQETDNSVAIINDNKKKNIHMNNNIACLDTMSNCDSNHSSDNEYFRSPLKRKLNVSFLKNMATATARTDRWYIVVDTNVLLSNLKFVDILIKSDPTCRMLVPYQVHSELERLHLNRRKCHKNARLATHYIARELKLKTAVVGQTALKAKELKITCSNGDDLIINCCLQAIEEFYHVVLLTNDITLCSKAQSSEIVSFTLKQVKDCIYSKNNTGDEKEEFKIIIPNIIDRSRWSFEGHIANNILGYNTVVNPKENLANRKIISYTNQPIPMIPLTTSTVPKEIDTPLLLRNNIRENSDMNFNLTQNEAIFQHPQTIENITINKYVPNVNSNKFHTRIMTREEKSYKNANERVEQNQITGNRSGCWSLGDEMSVRTVSTDSTGVEKFLFDLRRDNIDENFVRRSDEWVSCFEKIMEALLTNILQLFKIKNGMLSPPWSFREAIYNIRILFDFNQDLVEISNKLYSIILLNSDYIGNIIRNIYPKDFMKMFNLATELVKAMKEKYPNNRYVEEAENRLLNLINNIKHVDNGHLENNLNSEFDITSIFTPEREVSKRPLDISSSDSGSNQSRSYNNKNGDQYSEEGSFNKSVIKTLVGEDVCNIESFIRKIFLQISITFKTIRDFNAKCNSLRIESLSVTLKSRIKPKVAQQFQTVYGISNLLERIMQREAGPEVMAGILEHKRSCISTNYRNAISKSIRIFKLLLDDLDVIRTKLNAE